MFKPTDREGPNKSDPPSILTGYEGGLYAGPTSAAAHLVNYILSISIWYISERNI